MLRPLSAPAVPNAAEIRRALSSPFAPGQVVELRALEVSSGGRAGLTVSGSFFDLAALAAAALKISTRAKGVARWRTMGSMSPISLADPGAACAPLPALAGRLPPPPVRR